MSFFLKKIVFFINLSLLLVSTYLIYFSYETICHNLNAKSNLDELLEQSKKDSFHPSDILQKKSLLNDKYATPPELSDLSFAFLKLNYNFGTQSSKSLSKSLLLINDSILLRPTHAQEYAMKAYIFYYMSKPMKNVFDLLDVARRLGPYEQYVAEAYIDLAFSYWPNLELAKKKIALDYLAEPEKYGFNRWTLDAFVSRTTHTEKLCNVMTFLNRNLPSCHR